MDVSVSLLKYKRKCKKCKKSTFIGHTDKKCGFKMAADGWPPPADKEGLVCMLHVSKDMDEEILYALHIMQCKTNGPLHQRCM